MGKKDKTKNNNQSDPSDNVENDSTFITCSFQMTGEQMKSVDIVKLNSLPNWGYEEVRSPSGQVQYWAKGKIESKFDSVWESVYADKDRCYELSKRSFRIDEQRDERHLVKKELGIAKETARGALNSFKLGAIKRLIEGGMSEQEAAKIINV